MDTTLARFFEQHPPRDLRLAEPAVRALYRRELIAPMIIEGIIIVIALGLALTGRDWSERVGSFFGIFIGFGVFVLPISITLRRRARGLFRDGVLRSATVQSITEQTIKYRSEDPVTLYQLELVVLGAGGITTPASLSVQKQFFATAAGVPTVGQSLPVIEHRQAYTVFVGGGPLRLASPLPRG